MGDWFYKGEVITVLSNKHWAGFVYLITNITNGKMYIGKKFLTSTRRLPPLKGKKRKRVATKESNWLEYYGSSDDLKNDIEILGDENFEREILHLCKTRAGVNQLEVIEQFKRNVLYSLNEQGEREYYNNNISGKFFPLKELIEDESFGISQRKKS